MARLRSLFRARMAGWAWVTIALLVLIVAASPQKLLLVLFKLALITAAAWLAYWLDRRMFPYARPDAFLVRPFSPGGGYAEKQTVADGQHIPFAAAMLRRALIVLGAVIAAALGA